MVGLELVLEPGYLHLVRVNQVVGPRYFGSLLIFAKRCKPPALSAAPCLDITMARLMGGLIASGIHFAVRWWNVRAFRMSLWEILRPAPIIAPDPSVSGASTLGGIN